MPSTNSSSSSSSSGRRAFLAAARGTLVVACGCIATVHLTGAKANMLPDCFEQMHSALCYEPSHKSKLFTLCMTLLKSTDWTQSHTLLVGQLTEVGPDGRGLKSRVKEACKAAGISFGRGMKNIAAWLLSCPGKAATLIYNLAAAILGPSRPCKC